MKKIIENYRHKTYEFLRWSEKWTKTDMVYLFEGLSWITFGRILSSLASFLLVLAFANLLPQQTYGIYKYILSIIALLSIPTLTGMGTAVVRATAQGYEGSVVSALKTKIRWGILSTFASLILAGYYYFNNDTVLTIAFLITSIFLPFMDTFGIYASFLRGKKNFKLFTVYGFVKQIISVLVIISILFISDNIFLILFSYLTSTTILNFFFFKLTQIKIGFNKEKSPDAISFGKHLSLMQVINIIAGQIDKILLWHYLGAIPLAIYSFSLSPVLRMRSFINPISTIALPKFSGKNHNELEEVKKELLSKIYKVLFILIPIVFIYIILAPYFYKIFFPQYIDSIIYSQFYALALLVAPFALTSTYITAKAHKKYLYILSVIQPLVKIIFLFILLPIYGIGGAIAGLLLSHLFNILTSLYFFKKI